MDICDLTICSNLIKKTHPMVDIVGQLPLRIAIVETTAIFAFMKMSHKCRKKYFFTGNHSTDFLHQLKIEIVCLFIFLFFVCL